MIAYLKGRLEDCDGDTVTVDVGGIGYELCVPLSTVEKMPARGMDICLHTHMSVRDDGISLFGFLHRDELKMFRRLINVSGIGPKGALSILSVLSTEALCVAVLSGDYKSIAKAPGIGKKTAEKLIIELKDKTDFDFRRIETGAEFADYGSLAGHGAEYDAIEALMTLGYGGSEAAKAVKKVSVSRDSSAEEILKEALKHII